MCKYYNACPAADKRSHKCTIHYTECDEDCVRLLIEAYHTVAEDMNFEELMRILR